MGNENCDEDTKTWDCKGQGLYKHTPSEKLYWRTEVNGKRTFHVLEANNIKLAREEIEALKKLTKKLTSHGMRAFYVLIRRSQGASDEQIAFEIGHSSNGACIKNTYGSAPESWKNGGGPNLSWLPEVPAWAELEKNGWKFPKTPKTPGISKVSEPPAQLEKAA